jgi:hypothetical protein
MSWTKREIVNQAFEEIGFASYNFDLDPDQLQSALRKLDSMMATWNIRGVRISFPLASSPDVSDLDQDTELPDWAIEAVYKNLSIRIAPSLGKVLSRETKADAKNAYNTLLMMNTKPKEMQITGLPRGAGNKTFRYSDRPFLDKPTEPLLGGGDGEIDFN